MKIARFLSARVPNRYSIRWRLPLSYAGIALLTAVALGGLLLFTLNRYYEQQEQEYLRLGAQGIAHQIEIMYRDQMSSEEIQSSVNIFAFLARARVQFLDVDGQIAADSGPAKDQTRVDMHFRAFDSPPPPQEGTGPNPPREPYLSVGGDIRPAESAEGETGTGDESGRRYPLDVRPGVFGQFLDSSTSSGEYSNQRVNVAIYDPSGAVLTYIRLSEGPAFGNEIVRDVAQNSVLAGVLAVLIAVVAGGLVSQGISHPVLALVDVTRRMAQGDLAIRAEIERRDEFGLLGKTFNSMAARVEATVSTLRQFVADAAHEINTPLTALRTNLELMTIRHTPEAPLADIQQALAELTRLEQLTRGLLTLARLEAPDVMRLNERLDLAVLVRQLYERYASRAEQSEIGLVLEVPENTVPAWGDQGQIVRALDNLLDNALKFTPQNGRVTVGCCVVDHRVRVWVQDTGIGIPETDLPKLFSRFHRGGNAAAFPGNGLGLVITKAIVLDHGGEITVRSDENGTCFTVTLPVFSEGTA